DRLILYPTGTGAIQIRTLPPEDGRSRYMVWIWHPAGDRAGMAVYENWFWRETYRFYYRQAAEQLREAGADVAKFPAPDLDRNDLWDQRMVHEQLRRLY